MNRFFITLVVLVICLKIINSGECQEEKQGIIKDLNYSQKEFYNQWKYLSNREKKFAQELNEEVELYNRRPSFKSLKKIEDLKIQIIDNLQNQIRSDRGYIAYLEPKLSELLDYKFSPLRFEEDTDVIQEAVKELTEEEDVAPLGLEEEADKIEATAKRLLKEIAQEKGERYHEEYE